MSALSKKQVSMSRRLSLALVSAMTLIVVLVASSFYLYTAAELERNFSRKVDETLSYLDGTLGRLLWYVDHDTVARVAETVLRDDLVVGVTVLDEKGGGIFSNHEQDGDEILLRTHSIHFQDRTVGELKLIFSRAPLSKTLTGILLTSLLVWLLAVLSIAVLTNLFIRKYFRGPLQSFTDLAEAYRQHPESTPLSATPFLEFQPIENVVKKLTNDVLLKLRDLVDANKALSESKDRFKTLVANIPGVTYRCNVDKYWTMDFISDEINTLCGYSAEEFIGNHVRSFASIIYPDDKEMVKAEINAAVKRHQPFIIEYRIMHVDGGVRWVYERGQAIFDKNENENVISLDGVIFDITERKNSEDALHKAKEEASQQRERLSRLANIQVAGEMATSFAHELNQPLAAIESYAQAGLQRLETDSDNVAKLTELLDKIRNQANRAGNVIVHLRAMVKKREIKNDSVEVNGLLYETVGLVENEIASCGCRVQIISEHELPVIEVDKIQIQQVVLNLIRNAIDAVCDLEEEEKKLLVIQSSMNKKHEVRISVTDDGNDIPDSEVGKLFEPFYTTKETGMGIGLSICQTIIESHGGKIYYSPNPVGGAIFYFTLPVDNEA